MYIRNRNRRVFEIENTETNKKHRILSLMTSEKKFEFGRQIFKKNVQYSRMGFICVTY